MQKVDISKVPVNRIDPIFRGFPEKLKDPKMFKKVEKNLLATLKTDHTHKTASEYVKCEECQANYKKRKDIMTELGFKSTAQYMQWKKVMTIIISKKNFQVR